MTMILIDGFDHDDAADVWTGITGVTSQTVVGSINPRTGTRLAGGGASVSGNYNYRALSFAEIDDGVTMGMAFWIGSNFGGFGGGIGGPKIAFAEDGVFHVSANFRSDTRSIELWRGLTAAPTYTNRLAYTDTNIFVFNAWNYLELGVKIADSGGLAEVRLNGVTILTYVGDTNNGGAAGVVNRMGFIGVADVGSGQTVCYDDVYMLNEQGSSPWNSFLGDTRCYPLYPSGNGFYSELDGSDGNSTDNYALVDEVGTISTADYVGSVTDGEIDTYEFQDITDFQNLGTVAAIESRIHAAKTETGTKQVRLVVRRSGNNAFGPDHVLPQNTYGTFRYILEQDPHAGPGAWTLDTVDDTEFGVEIRP